MPAKPICNMVFLCCAATLACGSCGVTRVIICIADVSTPRFSCALIGCCVADIRARAGPVAAPEVARGAAEPRGQEVHVQNVRQDVPAALVPAAPSTDAQRRETLQLRVRPGEYSSLSPVSILFVSPSLSVFSLSLCLCFSVSPSPSLSVSLSLWFYQYLSLSLFLSLSLSLYVFQQKFFQGLQEEAARHALHHAVRVNAGCVRKLYGTFRICFQGFLKKPQLLKHYATDHPELDPGEIKRRPLGINMDEYLASDAPIPDQQKPKGNTTRNNLKQQIATEVGEESDKSNHVQIYRKAQRSHLMPFQFQSKRGNVYGSEEQLGISFAARNSPYELESLLFRFREKISQHLSSFFFRAKKEKAQRPVQLVPHSL